jgi:hypothetical protein
MTGELIASKIDVIVAAVAAVRSERPTRSFTRRPLCVVS